MDDELKHADGHGEEIRELVEALVQTHLLGAATTNGYCPRCVAVALLEWDAYAAAAAGATTGELTSAVADGAVTGEEEIERVEMAVGGREARH